MTIAAGVLAGMVAYAIVLAALAILAQPLRRRMYHIAKGMMETPGWTAADRNEVLTYLWFAKSFWSGYLIPIACIAMMADAIMGRFRMPKETRIDAHPDAERFAGMVFVSMFAANPVFMLCSIPGLLVVGAIVFCKSASFSPALFREMVEDAILRASPRLIPAH